jgi:hypothetical protein
MKKKLTKAQLGLEGFDPQNEQGMQFYWNNIVPNPKPNDPSSDVSSQGLPQAQRVQAPGIHLNWNHILGSQVIQAGATALANSNPNSFQNATKRFNNQFNPTSWLPQNPNTGTDAYYGTAQMGGAIIDAYIKDFLFSEDPKPSKEDPIVKKKKSSTDNSVTEDDVAEVEQEGEEMARRVMSRDTIARLLGASSNQSTSSPTVPYTGEIKSDGQFGNKNIGQYGQQIYAQVSQDLGYAPVANSIYRSKSQNDALIAAGKPASPNSWHLTGNAVDFKPADWAKLPKERQAWYKQNYDVIYHDNHYHVEPKGKQTKQMGGEMPNLGSPSDIYDSISLQDAFGHAEKLKTQKNGKFKALIPMEWWTDELMNYTEKFKIKEKNGERYVKIKGDADLYGSPNHLQFQKGGRAPITVTDPNDPRLRAYTDSLLFHNVGENQIKELNKLLKNSKDGKNISLSDSQYLLDIVPTAVYKAESRLSKLNGRPPEPIKSNPFAVLDQNTIGYGNTHQYKKPVQPIVYQPEPKEPKFKPVTTSARQDSDLSVGQVMAPSIPTMPKTYKWDPNKKTNFSFTGANEKYLDQNTMYFPNQNMLEEFVKSNTTAQGVQSGKGWASATGYLKQKGGIVNTTGYTAGSETENNPVNVIPSGDITMANVYSPVMAIPMKNGKPQSPTMMQPGMDYAFDADETVEFKVGGTYDVTPEQLEQLKKLGYNVEIL